MGFKGGHDGRTAGVYVKRRADARFRPFTEAFGTVSPSKLGNILIHAGDHVMIESAGGGGYGRREQREPELVLRDVVKGFVSEQAAREQYHVAIRRANGRLAIDERETALSGGRGARQ
jgi:N-methylhydantoinase B